ncbi:MAG: hypothetical protein IKK52_00430 [Alphaproteobacteria bacterium]|nr:hypothetical protein [Alphaproteobacteria bacterium]
MLKKTLFFLLSFLLSQSIAWASIVSINNTKYTATRSYGINNTNDSEDTDSSEMVEMSGTESNDSGGEYADGGESTEPDIPEPEPDIPEPENDTYYTCYFNCLDIGADNCVYSDNSDIGSIAPDTTAYCTCPDTVANILLCDDSVFGSPDTVNYDSYPRGFGMSKNQSLSYDSNTGQYQQYFYYLSSLNTEEFCPLKAQANITPIISALSTSYYNNAKQISCSNPLFGLSLIGDSSYGIQSCLPPQATDNNQYVSICVYEPTSTDINDYRKKIDYTKTGNDKGLENCASKINKLTSSGSRSLYAMNDNSDIPNNAQDYYYLYQPDSSYSVVGDYYATECFINCGTSAAPIIGQSYDISPYCQGYYYLRDCSNFMSEESNNYYLSNTYKEYMNAVAEHAFSGKTEICYDSSNNIKMSFARCGLKHSVDSTHGVYKESECNLGNGTCIGGTGAYICDGDNYCSKCTCNSNLVTLAQWCAASGITTNCNTDNYVHYGNVCNYDSELKAERWVLQSCSSENQYLAVADTGSTYAQLKTGYGTGIKAEYCYDNGALKWQVTCDSDYNMLCYPTATSTEDWCIHGHNDETTMRSEAQSANPSKYCQVNTVNQGVCGASVLLSDGTILTPTNDIKIYKVSSADECYAKFGKAATAQVCSASAGSSDIDGFNCYYDLRAFKYSTNTANGAKLCEVRHDLRGDYVLYNGQKRWAECNCVDLYKYSVYNCSGSAGSAVLSGNACKQDLSNVNYSASLIEKWRRAGLPYDAEHNQITISSVNLHPYCKCKQGINYTCDTNPGRIEGDPSGDTCVVDGKTYYSSCICHPDDLPDNWADSYFGCPSGSKPTGVWKDNGCGQKIYQCSSTITCTDEYTETCDGVGEVGDGQGCQDNEGNYVRWKACKCSSEYSYECTENNEGVGEACTADGGEKYTACSCPSEYQACVAPAVVASGATVCMMINMSGQARTEYYSACSCPESYTSCSTDGQEGDPSYATCVSGGVTLYERCKCPDNYDNCNDATKYPLVTVIPNAYTGVTTSGYGSCKVPNVAWTEYRYQACKCNEEKFVVCEGTGATPIGVSCQTEYDQSKLWTGCQCGSGYTDQCLATEGKVVNPNYDYDYCQIGNGAKYYKESSCLCEADGWIACTGNGQSGLNSPCHITGSSESDKYKGCGCESTYSHKCDGAGEEPPTEDSKKCITSSGTTFYSECDPAD